MKLLQHFAFLFLTFSPISLATCDDNRRKKNLRQLQQTQQTPCGEGFIGTGLCADPSLCCSEYGYCDSTNEHCNPDTCHSGPGCPQRGIPCGGGTVGTGVCENPSLCCSEYGYCDSTEDHCNYSKCWSGPDCPRNGAPCGNGNVGNGICEDTSLCCSQYGYCGFASDQCDSSTCYSSPDNSCIREAAVDIPSDSTYTQSPMPTPSPSPYGSAVPSDQTSTQTPVPTPSQTVSVVPDSTVVSSAQLIVEIDPEIQNILNDLEVDPTNENRLKDLRIASVMAWSSESGLQLASKLDSSDEQDPTYAILRESAEFTNPMLCTLLQSRNTLFSTETIECVCGTSGKPSAYCAALADREVIDNLRPSAGRRQQNRALSCEIESPIQGNETGAEDLMAFFEAITMGGELCLGATCQLPLSPQTPFIGLELKAGGCIPGLNFDLQEICSGGECTSFSDAVEAVANENSINAVTDPRVYVGGGLCLLESDLVPFVGDIVLPTLEFIGMSHCIAEFELNFFPLMGYLAFGAKVGFGIVSLSVDVEAQFYDDIKSMSGVCELLDGDQCVDQEDESSGQNSCSLCANQDRGKLTAEVGVWIFKESFEIPWGENVEGECRSCQENKSCLGDEFFDTLTENVGNEFNSEIFLVEQPDPSLPPVPSSVYKFEDLTTALKKLQGAEDQFRFWLGDDCSVDSQKAALVNIAAFLGQSMRETIIYDACDENSYDKWRADIFKEPTSSPEMLTYLYPMSAGCGQLGQKYAEYDCDDACPQDLNMETTATTNAKWVGAPPPLFCGPKSKYDGLGYWNPHKLCNDGSCSSQPFYYDGQTQGVYVPVSEDDRFPDYFYTNPLPDESGVTPDARPVEEFPTTNVEGCCWWGRGVIQTTGRCNFGKLNKYLGAGAGPGALYPEIDFCQNPESICTGPSDLKWVAGVFFWVSSVGVQEYDSNGFNYQDGVKQYVSLGCADDPDQPDCDFLFEYASGIVNRGCHNPEDGCPGCIPGVTCGPAHKVPERVEASKKALRALMSTLL